MTLIKKNLGLVCLRTINPTNKFTGNQSFIIIDCLCIAVNVDRCKSVFLSLYVRLTVCKSGRLNLFISSPELKLKLK